MCNEDHHDQCSADAIDWRGTVKRAQSAGAPDFDLVFTGSFEFLALIFSDSPAFVPDFRTVLIENCSAYRGSKCGISTLPNAHFLYAVLQDDVLAGIPNRRLRKKRFDQKYL